MTTAFPGWADGTIAYAYTNRCFDLAVEVLGGSWVGQFRNDSASPKVGDVYYLRVAWSSAGNPCAGGFYAHAEVQLPSFTQLAISSQNPVYCFYQSPSAGSATRFTNGCPQAPTGIGLYGGLSFDPADNSGAWPSATGAYYELRIPVKTSRPLDGLIAGAGQGCPSCFFAGVWMIDGNFSPWTFAVQGVYVNDPTPPPAPEPYVDYPAPNHYQDGSVSTQWWTAGFVYTEGTNGIITSHLREGTSGTFVDAPGISVPAGAWRVDQPWNPLQPGRTYQFKVCYDPAGAMAVRCGALQTFKVPNLNETNPPNTSILNKPPKFTNSTSASFTFESTELGSKFRCVLDSGAESDCGVTTYTGLAPGVHRLSVVAVDAAGNRDPTPAVYSWTVDLTDPIATVRLSKSGRDVTMRFSADEPARFQCKRDGSSYKGCTSPKTYSGLSRGLHTFTVRPKDRAGNVGEPVSKTIRV